MKTPPSKPRVVEYPAGALIFRQGEAGHVMYILKRGSVEVRRQVRGRDYVLTVLHAGSFFGELAIVNNRPRSATVVAREPVQVLAVTEATLSALLEDDSELAARLIKVLAQRIDRLTLQLESLLQGRDHYQVFESLCELVGQKEPAGVLRNDSPPRPRSTVVVTPADLARPGTLSEVKTAEILEQLARAGIVATDSATDSAGQKRYVVTETDTLIGLLQSYVDDEAT